MAPARVQEVEESVSPPTTMELTPVEDTLRRLLLDVAAYIDTSPSSHSVSQGPLPEHLAKQNVTLRFTGGWVRDKLLGVPSHDIDVAINKMTGEQFGYRMKEYLEVPGNPEKYGLEGVATTDKQSQKAGASTKSKVVGGLHKIEANPEKSKHLETVTTRILGLDIDLVNLRKETYTDDSRNPQMEFGTPEEDAMRRDATVNAMFYNINTGEIEDFTGRGHEDMRNKIIRTPLEPYQTFKDDPLRVLRLIRFSSRLNYEIDEKALAAMRDETIKDALRRKISRERVGTELEKSLHGPDPHEALRLIFDLDLYFTIFSDPTITTDHYEPDTSHWRTAIDCLEDAISNENPLAEILMRDGEEQFMAWQLAAFLPYRDAPQPLPTAPGRKPPPPIAASVAREGIKATNKVGEVVISAVRNQTEIAALVDRLYQQQRRPDRPVEGEDPSARDVLGMAIRRWGPSWRSQVIYAFLVDVVDSISTNDNALAMTERKYTIFTTKLQQLDLLDAETFKPLIDGKALASALGVKPGPWMKDALETVMAWQLRNPDSTDPAEAIELVRTGRGELPRSLAAHFLRLTIRPLFQASKPPPTVTAAGRRVETAVLPTRLGMGETDESVTKPWKTGKEGALGLELLRWVVVHALADGKAIEPFWPLLIPPILTLLDDWEAAYKSLGAESLLHVLKATPADLLRRTGLGDVFEQALLPCLTYLPPLTPEPDSIALLNSAYPALLQLTLVRFPASSSTTTPATTGASPSPSPSQRDSSNSSVRNLHRTQALTTILRTGILNSFSQAGVMQFPRIMSALFAQLVPLLDALGLDAVPQLRALLGVINEALGNGVLVGAASNGDDGVEEGNIAAEALVRAAQALQAVGRNSWPRIAEVRVEVLKGVVGCWARLERGRRGDGVERVRRELRATVEMVDAVVKIGGEEAFGEWEGEKKRLVQVDGGLEGLLFGG